MRTFPTAVVSLLLLLPLDVHAASVTDGVQMLRSAGGSSGDAMRALRTAAGLGSAPRTARGAVPAGPPVDVRFTLDADVALAGYRVDVTYPLATGGFAGSADAAECTSSGGGFFFPNDRDDGTLTFVEARVDAFPFPIVITCRFEQAAGATLAPADLGVVVVEVTEENGTPGDPAHLGVTVAVGDEPVAFCVDGQAAFSTVFGGVLDLGWTGIAHDQPLPSGVRTSLPLTCTAGDPVCAIDGAPLVGQPIGAPIPISAGGVSTCIVPRLTAAPTGTVDCDTGCTSAALTVEAKFFLVLDQDHPCPRCAGDVAANDGAKDGTCLDGATPGGACDAHGGTERYGSVGPDFGTTSRDCMPAGVSVGEPIVTLDPLTTGTTTVHASVDCLSPAFPPGSCFCPNQVQPNACIPDGVCGASGFCENNPPDGVCSEQPFRQCDLTAGNRDCEDTFPGAGACTAVPRPCFGETIERTGSCGGADAAFASVFCMSPTRAAAINTVYGFPGPAALHVPIRYGPAPEPTETVPSTPRATPTPGAPTATPTPQPGDCDPSPRGDCAGFGSRDSVVTMRDDHADDFSWRWSRGSVIPPTDFGRPDVDTGYAVCVYASPIPGPTPGTSIAPLLLQAKAPAAVVCGDDDRFKFCWKPTRDGGWVYRDPHGDHGPVTRLALGHNRDGSADIVVKSRGLHLLDFTLPLPAAPIVQLQATNGACWSEFFRPDEVLRNDFKRFRARSQAR